MFRSGFPGAILVNCNLRSILEYLPEEVNGFYLVDFYKIAAVKDFSELIPHNTQSFLMLGIAVERYILVCHAAVAKVYYTMKVRLGFYLLITLLLLLSCVLPVGELLYFLIKYEGRTYDTVGYWVSYLKYQAMFLATIFSNNKNQDSS